MKFSAEKDGPLWRSENAALRPPLDADLDIDVAIVGGGIVGLSAAHCLAESGLAVAVFEAAEAGAQATGRSTAKVTAQHGLIYDKLVSDIGEEGARLYAQANQAAVGWIAGRAKGHSDCFEATRAYVYANRKADTDAVRKEAEVAARLGLPSSFVSHVEMAVENHGAVCFEDQGQIEPCLFARLLAEELPSNATLYEKTRIVDAEHGEPCLLHTKDHRVRAKWVIVATQMPIVHRGLFYAKAYPHTHAVVAAMTDGKSAPDGMFISSGLPKRSFRPAKRNDADYLVATGPSFKPGEAEAQTKGFDDLCSFLQETFGLTRFEHFWTNEDFQPMDGLPFIGAASGATPRLLVATGFNAWGLTTGVVAAQILAGTISGEEHPLASYLHAKRLRPLKGAATFLTQNSKAGIHLAADRLSRGKGKGLDAIEPGEGAVIRRKGKKFAVSRSANGELTAVSAVCTHMGCVVGWNPTDRTWDCPCHGSRFSHSGAVRYGPAVRPLEPVHLADDAKPDIPPSSS